MPERPTGKVLARVQLRRQAGVSAAQAKDDAPSTRRPDGPAELLARGRALLREGAYREAADSLSAGAGRPTRTAELELLTAWASYLAGGRDRRWRRRLGELCAAALAEDGRLAFAHHVRGQLALAAGDHGAARDAFLRATELDPDDREARRALARLG